MRSQAGKVLVYRFVENNGVRQSWNAGRLSQASMRHADAHLDLASWLRVPIDYHAVLQDSRTKSYFRLLELQRFVQLT